MPNVNINVLENKLSVQRNVLYLQWVTNYYNHSWHDRECQQNKIT